LAKKRGQQNIPLRIAVESKPLQERLLDIHKFRKQHEELRAVIVRVLPDPSAVRDVASAFDEVKDVDVLNLSKEGIEVWELAVKRYDQKIDRIESQIIAHLRDRLATAR